MTHDKNSDYSLYLL